MRLDYALYGLAIVLFALTAITFVYAPDAILYGAITAIVGAIAVVGGYALKPRNDAAPVMQTPVSDAQPPAEATQQTPTPAAEAPTPEEPPMATPVEAATSQSIAENETPKVAPETPVAAATMQVPEDKISEEEVCPAPIPAEASSQNAASPAEDTEFGRIRGISAKRAEQLKANGINNLQELANADAVALAEKLEVSPKIVKMWIGCAKKQVK